MVETTRDITKIHRQWDRRELLWSRVKLGLGFAAFLALSWIGIYLFGD